MKIIKFSQNRFMDFIIMLGLKSIIIYWDKD